LGQVHLAIAVLLALAGPLGAALMMIAARPLLSWFPGRPLTKVGTLLRTPVFKLVRLLRARASLLGVLPDAALQLRTRRVAHDDLFSLAGVTVASSFCRLPDADEDQDAAPSQFLRGLAAAVGAEDSQFRFESAEAALRSRALGYATLCWSFLDFLSRNRWSATAESERVLTWLNGEWARINGAQSVSELLGE
jgi:hypothetical protein